MRYVLTVYCHLALLSEPLRGQLSTRPMCIENGWPTQRISRTGGGIVERMLRDVRRISKLSARLH